MAGWVGAIGDGEMSEWRDISCCLAGDSLFSADGAAAEMRRRRRRVRMVVDLSGFSSCVSAAAAAAAAAVVAVDLHGGLDCVRRVVGQEAMVLADGAATEMLVMMDDEAVEWCKTGMELFLFEGGHLNGGGSWLAGWI